MTVHDRNSPRANAVVSRLVALAILSSISAAACTSGPPPPVDNRPYADELAAARTAKDQMLRTDPQSPIPADKRTTFNGLAYFDIRPEYRVSASLKAQRGGPPIVIDMQFTNNGSEKMVRVGTLGFSLAGGQYTLTAFADPEDRAMARLFVPFGDLTNNKETYGGGRYLDLTRTPTGYYEIDFNRAYHPNCVYDPTWVCPVPPRENRLDVAIPAGERLPASYK